MKHRAGGPPTFFSVAVAGNLFTTAIFNQALIKPRQVLLT